MEHRMNRQRIVMSVVFLAAMAFTSDGYSQSVKTDSNDCSALPGGKEREDCRLSHQQTKTVFLQNASTQNAAHEILVAVRHMAEPATKIFLPPTQNAIVVATYPQEIARIESLIRTLDVALKSYRLTYTL